jgi:type I restriction enzyme, S subunit
MQELLTNGIDKNGQIRTPQTHAYKQTELGLIPDEWEATSINLLLKNLDSKRIPLKEGDRQEINGQYPYYGASGIIDWVDDYIFDGEYILLGEDGENVVSRVLPLAFKATGKIWVNNHAHVFQCKKDVNIDYIVNLLESTDYKSIINGSAQPKITQDGLNKLFFKIAPKNEQKQIARILNTQDKKIEREERNLAKLKELKKGLMTDLLSGVVRVKV